MSENKPNYIFATGNVEPLNKKSEGRRYMSLPQKQKYIALLTEGNLEQEIIDALHGCGYVLENKTEYSGCITNHYVKKETKYKNFSNFGNVCDITCGMG